MKLAFKKLIVVLTLFFLPLFAIRASLWAQEFPKPVGQVNDFADIFSAEFEDSLEADLVAFEQETTIEIAVVTVENLQGTTVEDFAVRLFEDWGIGKEETDNGLLFLVAPNERQVRIEVGYGLEPVMTDSRAGRIIRQEMTPEFKKDNYEKGVQKGVDKAKSYLVAGEPPQELEKVVEGAENYLPLVIIAFVLMIYFSSFWGRTKRVWPGGVVGAILGLLVGLIIGVLIWKVLFPLIFALLGFLLDLTLSRNYKKLRKAGRPTSWWRSGGGFFSGGGGGGGFGGFGGGSSGGGGASGSW